MRRIVHYTDDAGSPVNGTESVNDVWQGFRYDFFMLLSAMEKADLSGDAKRALCAKLQYLLSDMSCGVEKMSGYVDFMAKWREGFSETPVKESPVKKRRGKTETTSGGTAEELFPEAEPGEDADKGTPAGDGPEAEGVEEVMSPETNPCEDAEKEDSEGIMTETAAAAGIEDLLYASEEEASQARFVATHGREEDEEEGTGKDGVTHAMTINDLHGGDEENGGEEGTLCPDNETEEK